MEDRDAVKIDLEAVDTTNGDKETSDKYNCSAANVVTSSTGITGGSPSNIANGTRNSVNVTANTAPPDCKAKEVAPMYDLSDDKTDHSFGLHAINGSTVSFQQLNYSIKSRPVGARACSCQKESLYILKDISGIFRPGLNAVLGPTGSGKTTLLDLLAGRRDTTSCSGNILIDGKCQPQNFKCMSGYLMQDDIIMGMLTVRENIEFSAALRLPNTTSASQRRDRVDEVIADLGLSKCASSRVGNEFVRGVSGGERKRTNIAMELITLPRVLFLDEPTTGLDANTAYSVIHLLKRLSQRGMTLIMSIHQPRYTIYKLFDALMLLSNGQCVYHGPANEALDFFSSAKFHCEEHNNPPDFFLDVLSGSIAPTSTSNTFNSKALVEGLDLTSALLQDSTESELVEERVQSLISHYKASKWCSQLENDLNSTRSPADNEKPQTEAKNHQRISYPTSFCSQLAVVTNRTWRNMVRNHRALITQMFSAVILGLIVGTIYFQVDDSCASGIQNRVGAFFFIVLNYVFGNMSMIDTFIRERTLFRHETVSGYYRVSTYFFAKMLGDVFPQKVLPIILFVSISYFMIGFQISCVHFLFFGLNTILTNLAGVSVALYFSAATRQHSIGSLLTALVWVCMMVFGGNLVNIPTIPQFLQWLKWLSIFRYSLNAFEINELKGLEFHDFTGNTTCVNGNEYLSQQSIPHEHAWDLWCNELALFLIGAIFLGLTYMQLRRSTTVR